MDARIAAVKMRDITKTFGSVVANDKVWLDIYRGEILALLGENGSGKTTLMNMLSGIYFPDEGQIFIDDEEVATATPATADIALRGSQAFAMAYTAPSTAGTHKAQVKIYFSNGDEAFATAETDLEVSWPALTLNESETNTIEEGTFNVTLKRQFAEGWNTVCLPFVINDMMN